MPITLRFALPLTLAISLGLNALGAFAEAPSADDASLIPKRRTQRRHLPGTSLTEDTLALARMLQVEETIDQLKVLVKEAGSNPNQEQLVKIMYLRQNCQRATQFASLELEEALANIDGDLSYTDLEYSLFSAKHDRSVMLNNAATFMTSGTLGVTGP